MKVKISKEEIIKASLYGLKIINGKKYALLNVDYDIELEAEPIEEKESHPQIKPFKYPKGSDSESSFVLDEIGVEKLNQIIRAVNALSK
jgi:hypothetical protein